MGSWIIVELLRNSDNWDKVVEEIVRTRKTIFPYHDQFPARPFDEELRKSNIGLLYSQNDGSVAGYIVVLWPSSLSALIAELAVNEKYRRRGLGEALLKAGIEKCRTRDIHRITLHVDPQRTAAMNLYMKLGFKVDTLIEGFYPPDQNAYRMYLDFHSD